MRLMFLALAVCLACDSRGTKVVVSPPPPLRSSPGAAGGSPAEAAPNNPPAAPRVASPSSDSRSEGQPGCRFQRPEVWAGGKVAWLGPCQNGFAEGRGVLVNVVEGAEPERFYGQMDSGFQTIGVLQTESGFIAGHWNHGAIAPA
ncbi:MAG TPA: hypothetical protein VG963_33845, partial [Polyangiaceae bacterium]|nr:hypothetical protein [Polyangiaceae bacterium]